MVASLFQPWNAALTSGDAARIADRYAPDVVLSPTQSNRMRKTHEEIVDYFEHFLAQRPTSAVHEPTIQIPGPDAAVDSGVYVSTLTKDGRQRRIAARYTFVYELRGDDWLIVDHRSSAMPEPSG